MTDSEAIAAYVQTRDADAFQYLVMRYQSLVYSVCCRKLPCTADADDATQETFIKLARQAAEIKGNPAGWIYGTAWRTACDLAASSAARKARESAGMEIRQANSPSSDHDEITQVVDECLMEMEHDERELIVEYYLTGRTQDELAALAGISRPGAKQRLDKAVEKLRGLIRKRGVAVSLAALALFLDTTARAEVPAAVNAALCKIGLAGIGPSTAHVPVTATTKAAVKVLGVPLKLVVPILFAVIATVGAGTWYLHTRAMPRLGEVQQALNDYNAEEAALKQNTSSDEEIQKFRERWITKLLQLTERHKNAPNITALLVSGEALANSTGKHDVSIFFVTELLKRSKTWTEELRWDTEAGEVLRGIPERDDAATDYFEAACKLGRVHASDLRKLPTSPPPPDFGSSVLPVRDFLTSVCGLAWLKEYRKKELLQAADLYSEACAMYTSLPEGIKAEIQRMMSPNESYEETYRNAEMRAAARGNDLGRAKTVLAKLDDMPRKHWPTGHYVNDLAREVWPRGGEAYVEFVQNWLHTKPTDDYTPVLMFWLAGEFMKSRGDVRAGLASQKLAIPIYEELLAKYADFLTAHNAEALKNRAGGYEAGILCNLAIAYANTGQKDRARPLCVQFLEKYPNDQRVEWLGNIFPDVPGMPARLRRIESESKRPRVESGDF